MKKQISLCRKFSLEQVVALAMPEAMEVTTQEITKSCAMSEHDESYFLKQGEPAPVPVPDPKHGLPMWLRSTWGTRQGPVVCHWIAGNLHSVENIILPSGERGSAECFGVNCWRRSNGAKARGRIHIAKGDEVAWIWGNVLFSDNDAQFIDGQQPAGGPVYLSTAPELAEAIFSNPDLRAAVQDFETAVALRFLLIEEWTSSSVTGSQLLSGGDAGELIAMMRGRGETYIEWKSNYLDELPEDESCDARISIRKIELMRILNTMGWFLTHGRK